MLSRWTPPSSPPPQEVATMAMPDADRELLIRMDERMKSMDTKLDTHISESGGILTKLENHDSRIDDNTSDIRLVEHRVSEVEKQQERSWKEKAAPYAITGGGGLGIAGIAWHIIQLL